MLKCTRAKIYNNELTFIGANAYQRPAVNYGGYWYVLGSVVF